MYQRILVPVDCSATSNKGLDEAVKLAKLTGATLRLVHLVDELSFATGFDIYAVYPVYAVYAGDAIPLMKEAEQQILAQGRARAATTGVNADTLILESFATRLSDPVVEHAKTWNADLIVIGTHGRRGVGRLLLGSDAEQIVRTSPVPVLLVRAPEVDGADGAAP